MFDSLGTLNASVHIEKALHEQFDTTSDILGTDFLDRACRIAFCLKTINGVEYAKKLATEYLNMDINGEDGLITLSDTTDNLCLLF